MFQNRARPAASPITSRRRGRSQRKHPQLSRPLDPAHEIEVFHHGYDRHSAHLLQHTTAYKQRLIAIGQIENRDPKRHTHFDPALANPTLRKPKREGTPCTQRIGQGRSDSFLPSRFEIRIGMKKEHRTPGRFFTPHPKLAGASSRTDEDPGSGVTRETAGFIPTAAIDDNDFDSGCDYGLDGPYDARSFVECRDHHRNCHFLSLALFNVLCPGRRDPTVRRLDSDAHRKAFGIHPKVSRVGAPGELTAREALPITAP
jgi:hypothetical protein